MAQDTFPTSLDELTPAWLTEILRAAGALDRAAVTSLDAERVGVGVGFLGQLGRITPSYDTTEARAPATLIAKFPTEDAGGRELAAMYGLYKAEVNFYREIACDVATRTPRCYFGAVSDDGRTFALIAEDLAQTGCVGDQVAGCSLEHARMAVRELARFHAAWWNHPRLPGMAWMPVGTELGRISWEQAYPYGWQTAVERYRRFLGADVLDALPRLNERMVAMLPLFEGKDQTIMHGDYRLDNLFFGGEGSGYEVAVIDWQILNRGWATYDLAYFIGLNLPIADRRAHERELVREYLDALTQANAAIMYGWDDCWHDYVLSMVAYLCNLVGNVATLDTANERGVQLVDDMFERVATAVTDLGALALVP